MNAEATYQRVAVLGAQGQLGSELCRQLGRHAIPLSRHQLDLLQLDSIAPTLRLLHPDAVINAAAYTQVDRAESDADFCRTVNALAVREIASACRSLECPLAHVSTDYVFGRDGKRKIPYTELDAPAPVNVYGECKLEGENFASENPKHMIVRTCGLYAIGTSRSPHRNFVSAMLRKSSEGTPIRVVNDQWCTPTYVPHLAQAILLMLSLPVHGTYHVVNEGDTTWYQFARAMFQILEIEATLEPISSSGYPTPADRPAYSVLNCDKLASTLNLSMPSWHDALRDCLTQQRTPQSGSSN